VAAASPKNRRYTATATRLEYERFPKRIVFPSAAR
jgi:hypothetical protein